MELEYKQLTEQVIGAAIEVHRHLGPGLLESAYGYCLEHELDTLGLKFERQKPLPIGYKGLQLDTVYRLDLIIEQTVLLELKSVERLEPIHEAQLLTYLRLARLPVGFLINFNVPLLRQGIRRFAFSEKLSATSASPR